MCIRDREVTLTHSADSGLLLKHTATADDKPINLVLQTGETDMAADDVIGKISFQAPDEGTGTDAILVSAAIQARAEGDHSSSSNATSLDFMTGSSEAATKKWSVKSDGKFEAAGAYAVDLNAGELILDADADTSITADTDDQIDFKISGADDFRMTANNFNVLSGSTLTIDSGATITNSGTANNFGIDPESAYTGVLQTNANFVDQVIFGPAVDGRAWNGLWNKASLFSSLMLATLEQNGSDAEINIWDLTEQSSGAISTTPLATIAESGTGVVTGIAAAMGYVIVGCAGGVYFYHCHDGAWKSATAAGGGWPRYLNNGTVPALTNNDVEDVAAGFSDQPAHDPRTGGPMPTFWVAYGTGADVVSVLKDDGNVFDAAGTIGSTGVGADNNGFGYYADSGNRIVRNVVPVSAITADDWTEERIVSDNNYPSGIFPGTTFDTSSGLAAGGGTGGLSLINGIHGAGSTSAADKSPTAAITRAYNTGYMVGDIRGAWLANSKTVDRSYKANTLTENGTVTEAAVASGAELNGYSGFSTSNFLRRAHDTDLDFGTGSFSISMWFKFTASSANEYLLHIARPSAGDTNGKVSVYMNSSSVLTFYLHNSTSGGAADTIDSPSVVDDSVWHKVDCVRDTTQSKLFMYLDGVLVATDAGPLTSATMTDSSATFTIGASSSDTMPGTTGTYALVRLSTTAPTATQIRQMYDAEKGMFVASAECLLQSGSTDAVLDVDVDPLTSKVLVTQTDAITVFDGLVVDSKPTVNSGNSEKGKLWGDLRTEQNSANAYVTAPAVDQRQVNEMVRGLASDLPAGVDLSKAKAWASCSLSGGTLAIKASYNIKSITDGGVGDMKPIIFAVPFKGNFVVTESVGGGSAGPLTTDGSADYNPSGDRIERFYIQNLSGSTVDYSFFFACFGELENE